MRRTTLLAATSLLCLGTVSAHAEVLLSANKEVTTTSPENLGPISAVVDGDTGDQSTFSLGQSSNNKRQVTIDLEQPFFLSRLEMFSGSNANTSAIKNYRFWYSLDGTHYKPIRGATRRNLDDGDVSKAIRLSQPVQARFVRFVSLDAEAYSKIREIEVYGTQSAPAPEIDHFNPANDITDSSSPYPYPPRKDELDIRALTRAFENLPNAHPRLYGDSAQYWANAQHFEALDNKLKGSTNGYGTIKNYKTIWDKYTYDKTSANKPYPTSLTSIREAKFYLDVDLENGELPKGSMERSLRVMHLIRVLDGCLEYDSSCRFLESSIPGEMDQLKTKFIQFEFKNFQRQLADSKLDCATGNGPAVSRPKAFHYGGNGCYFDLGAINLMRPWTSFVDYFWDETAYWATENDKAVVMDVMLEYANMYLTQADDSDLGTNKLNWTVANPNNWNVITGEAAVRFAMLVYNKGNDEEAGQEVYKGLGERIFKEVLRYAWNHRSIYLDEGQYKEGAGYIATDFIATNRLNDFYMRTIGEPMHAMKWAVMKKTAASYLEAVSTDGHILNFGDVWKWRGLSNTYPLNMLVWEEMTGVKPYGSTKVSDFSDAEACLVSKFFANNYYDFGLRVPMEISPALARDWHTIAARCTADTPDAVVGADFIGSSYTLYNPYKEAVFRVLTDRQTKASKEKNALPHLLQSNQTLMGMTCVANAFPHREKDCFDVKWSVHGSRFIDDAGYGNFTKGYEFYQLRGSKGFFAKTHKDDLLQFYVKPLEEKMNLDKAYIAISVAGTEKRLAIKPFMAAQADDSGWTKVQIPLSDFEISDAIWKRSIPAGNTTTGVGIIAITMGSGLANPRDAVLGIDEITLRGKSGQTLLWYGDGYTGSLQGDALDHNEAKITVTEESGSGSAGGAMGTAQWLKIGAYGKQTGRVGLYYRDTPADRRVYNQYDTFPIGANSLIVPDARYVHPIRPAPQRTHIGQLHGKEATARAFTINGLQGVAFDASRVYGKIDNDEAENEGWLEKAIRYMIALPNGNFLVVDEFETKADPENPGQKRKSLIQEFWYSPVDEVQTCVRPNLGGSSHHVDVTMSGENTVDFSPRCMVLRITSEAEAAGRMTAASLAGDVFLKFGAPSFMADDRYFKRFITGDVIELQNRKGGIDKRRLLRFEPLEPVSADVRAFLFQAGLNHNETAADGENNQLKPQNLSVYECTEGSDTSVCIDATIDGAKTTLDLKDIVYQ